MNRRISDAVDALTSSSLTLRRTVSELTDAQVLEPSLLPDWTRGHVITHLARNADGLSNLIGWARTGVETPMYSSWESRSADIEAGSRRTAAELLDDLVTSEDRLLESFDGLDDEMWGAEVRFGAGGRPGTAYHVPVMRRIEVEIHHVDLDLDYTLAHLPADFVTWMIARRAKDLSERSDLPGFVLVGNDDEGRWPVGDGGFEVTGTPASLLGWLLGRTDGIGVHSDEPLPHLGPWH